jgi:hypothetical protein
MDLVSWLRIVCGLAGAVLAIYGVVIVVTGRARRADRRAFRRVTDAGLYYLCFGSTLALLMVGQFGSEHHQPLLAGAAIVVAAVLLGLAIRYRLRRDKRHE